MRNGGPSILRHLATTTRTRLDAPAIQTKIEDRIRRHLWRNPRKLQSTGVVFLKGAAFGAAAGAAAVIAPESLVAAQQPQAQRPAVPLPTAAQIAAETEPLAPEHNVMTVENAGSDFMA